MEADKLFRELNDMPNAIPGLVGEGAPTMIAEGATLPPQAKKVVDRLKPILDKAFEGDVAGTAGYAKKFENTTRLVMAQVLRNVASTSKQRWVKEATLAGTDVPSYQRQIIGMVLRAYPKMYATQLFPVTPFSGPDGRIYFKTTQYNSVYTGSAPNIANGDLVTDLSKFNKDYAQRNQQEVARKLKVHIDSITASVKSYRVTSEWTYEAEDDMQALYGDSLGSTLVNEMAMLVAWTTDRTLIDAAIADANSTQTWSASPSGYGELAPSEKKAYDESIWSDGILPLITKIQRKRTFSTYPTWFVVGTNLAERIQKLNSFVPVATGAGDELTLSTGALRDVGALRSVNIRVLVDPQLPIDQGVMGYRPTSSYDPAIHYCPYKPIRITGLLERPGTGDYEQGVYSRFAVVRKDDGTVSSSQQLGDAYGLFTVT